MRERELESPCQEIRHHHGEREREMIIWPFLSDIGKRGLTTGKNFSPVVVISLPAPRVASTDEEQENVYTERPQGVSYVQFQYSSLLDARSSDKDLIHQNSTVWSFKFNQIYPAFTNKGMAPTHNEHGHISLFVHPVCNVTFPAASCRSLTLLPLSHAWDHFQYPGLFAA